jgi:hypothetical protein
MVKGIFPRHRRQQIARDHAIGDPRQDLSLLLVAQAVSGTERDPA